MARTLKIYTDGSIATVDLDFDDYQTIRKEIGGYFETVKTRRMRDYFEQPVVMPVDEDGFGKKLPMNPVASLFYGSITTGNYIVGDVLLAVQMGEDIVAPSREDLDWWMMMLKRDFYLQERNE